MAKGQESLILVPNPWCFIGDGGVKL